MVSILLLFASPKIGQDGSCGYKVLLYCFHMFEIFYCNKQRKAEEYSIQVNRHENSQEGRESTGEGQ